MVKRKAASPAAAGSGRSSIPNADACTASFAQRLPVMFHMTDSRGRVLEVSEEWLRRMGYAREEVVGRAFADFIDAESRKPVQEALKPDHPDQEVCRDVPCSLTAKDGRRLHGLLSAEAEYDDAGKPRRFMMALVDVTELKQSEDLFAEAQSIARIGNWSLEIKSGALYWSEEIFRIFGQDPQTFEPSYESFIELQHPEDRERIKTTMEKAMQGVGSYEVEHRLLLPDRKVRHVRSLGRVEFDARGKPVRIMGTAQDITEYKTIQEALAKSEERFRTLVTNIPGAVYRCLLDPVWTMLYLSDDIEGISGYPAEDFINNKVRAYADIIHPEDARRVTLDVLAGVAEKHPFEMEYRILHASGKVRWCYEKGSAGLDESGASQWLDGIILDITGRKEAEQRLKDNEEMFRAMSEASHDALVMIDSKDVVHFWSPAAERMFGYARDEVMGRRLHPLITPPEDMAAVEKGLRAFADSGKGSVVGMIKEFTAVRRNGERFPVERAVAPLKVHGQWYAVGSLRDITERREAEKRLTHMATTDDLTGLANRRRFLELARNELERCRRFHIVASLLMIDVDRFKAVNDTYGHEAGDDTLRALAKCCTVTLRKVDTLGRMGGEEFAALLPETGLDRAMITAERLRKAVENLTVATDRGKVRFTVSIGAATFDQQTDNVEKLLKAADKAMYEAKQQGRNRVRPWPD